MFLRELLTTELDSIVIISTAFDGDVETIITGVPRYHELGDDFVTAHENVLNAEVVSIDSSVLRQEPVSIISLDECDVSQEDVDLFVEDLLNLIS